MLLTLTNPVESVTHVTLAACEEDDPDNMNSTSKVFTLKHRPDGGEGLRISACQSGNQYFA